MKTSYLKIDYNGKSIFPDFYLIIVNWLSCCSETVANRADICNLEERNPELESMQMCQGYSLSTCTLSRSVSS